MATQVKVYHATRTLAAIDAALMKDGGASFRTHLEQTLPAMDDAFRGDEESGPRSHYGISALGDECARKGWYSFHWAPIDKPKATKTDKTGEANRARMLRLWNRGHLEEARFLALIKMIGCTVFSTDANGKQFRVSQLGGHHGSAIDGVALGVPDVPAGEYSLLEFKTMAAKYFAELVEGGVVATNFKYYVQVVSYLHYMGLKYCLFMAVNKDTDHLYAEIILPDPNVVSIYYAKAEAVVFADRPLNRMAGASSTFWKCKFCDHSGYCYNRVPAAKNCRMCRNVEATRQGDWVCKKHGHVLTVEDQQKGCNDWEKHNE